MSGHAAGNLRGSLFMVLAMAAFALEDMLYKSVTLALPMGPGETSTLFVAQHDDLHRQATSLGVASWLGSILQGQ